MASTTDGFSMPLDESTEYTERVKIYLREVGNQLLLATGDSSSLISPVVSISDSRYEFSIDKAFSFLPDTLVNTVKSVFVRTEISNNYRVEVVENSSNEVAYSYEINEDESKTIIPCAGRYLPEARYTISVHFLDKQSPSSKYTYLLYILIPLILGILYALYALKKTSNPSGEENKEPSISIGAFRFFPDQYKLVKKAVEIDLSKKECELLEILVSQVNQVVTREELTKKVWEDNGVFVGRSLDTFISKLRKKLKSDDSIKIINIHGVGYKLEIS